MLLSLIWPTSASIRAGTSGSSRTRRRRDPAPHRRQARRLHGVPAGTPGAPREEDWPRHRRHRPRPALVPVLLLSPRREPDFVRARPVATKRLMRAVLKAVDICVTQPDRVARLLGAKKFAPREDYAFQALKEIPYDRWRQVIPKPHSATTPCDSTSWAWSRRSPKLIAQGTDWRFLNELKRELRDQTARVLDCDHPRRNIDTARCPSDANRRGATTGDEHAQLPHWRPSVRPQYVAEQLLRGEGFTNVRYVNGPATNLQIAVNSANVSLTVNSQRALWSPSTRESSRHPSRRPRRLLRAIREHGVRTVRDLKGRTVAVPALRSGPHLLLSIIATIGLDPRKDINWVDSFPARSRCASSPRARSTPSWAFPRSPRSSGQEDRARSSQHRDRQAVVSVLLLRGGRHSRVRAQAPGRHQASAARNPEGDRRVRP